MIFGEGKILVISARFYPDVSDLLERGAAEAIKAAGYKQHLIEVPGALEIPPAIAFAQNKDSYKGYVALGCVVHGETDHYEFVCRSVTDGLTQLAIGIREETSTTSGYINTRKIRGMAIGNGVLTVKNKDQALARALEKGRGAANAAICLINARKRFS